MPDSIKIFNIVNLANERVIDSINSKKNGGGGSLKKRDIIMGFDVSGIIKLLSNKIRLVSLNVLPIIIEIITTA
jgi:hypothetical protein